MIKDMAVTLPLNDIAKRDAIKNKIGFDVTKAIEIKNTKYDGETENIEESAVRSSRRAAPIKTEETSAAPSGRRYKPITKD